MPTFALLPSQTPISWTPVPQAKLLKTGHMQWQDVSYSTWPPHTCWIFPGSLAVCQNSCQASWKRCMQGRTDRLDPLPQEMLHSQVMLLAPNGVTMFLSSYEKHTVSWHISWHAPQSLAAELNAKLQHPTAAQVGWQVLDHRRIMTGTLQAFRGS